MFDYKNYYSLYIVLFLHQTTTVPEADYQSSSCISYYSYIKSQLIKQLTLCVRVVYRTIPTSNHNKTDVDKIHGEVVYRTIPTSNHNSEYGPTTYRPVVYRTIPTSNHNQIQAEQAKALVVYRTIPTSNHNLLLSVVILV